MIRRHSGRLLAAARRLGRRLNAVGLLRERLRGDSDAEAVLDLMLQGVHRTPDLCARTSLSSVRVNAARRRIWRHAEAMRSGAS